MFSNNYMHIELDLPVKVKLYNVKCGKSQLFHFEYEGYFKPNNKNVSKYVILVDEECMHCLYLLYL